SKTIFVADRFFKQVDELAAALRPAVKDESENMLARFEKVASGNSVEPVSFGGPGRFRQTATPIKPFVIARAQSVDQQLGGKSESVSDQESEFGPGQNRGSGEGPRGPGGFGHARMLERAFKNALDLNHDGLITHEEFTNGFTKWFEAWNTDNSGKLTGEQLRAGINRDLSPFRGGGPPAGPDLEPPDGPPEDEQ